MINFSIIVPVYNVEKYLPKCLDSLINQTYSNIEITCVNDGSPDNSLQILEEYASKDNRIKIINQENQGLSGARNTGLKNVTGDYVLFVDPDDWLELDTCETLYDRFTNNKDIDIIQYLYKKVSTNNIIYSENRFKDNETFYALDRLKEFFERCSIPSCCDKAYRYDFLKDNNIFFPDNVKAFFEDVIFGVNLYMFNPKVLITNKYFYNYYQENQNSICKTDYYKRFLLHKIAFVSLQELLNNIQNNDLKNIAYDYYLINIYCLFKNLYFSKYKTEYVEELKKARNYFDKNYQNLSTRTCDLYLMLVKFHIAFIYFKIFRPIGKYCVVLPYRKIKNINTKRKIDRERNKQS